MWFPFQAKVLASVRARIFCDTNRNRLLDGKETGLAERNYQIAKPNSDPTCEKPMVTGATNNLGVLNVWINVQKPGTTLWLVDPTRCGKPVLTFQTDYTGGKSRVEVGLPVPGKISLRLPFTVVGNNTVMINGYGGLGGNAVVVMCGKSLIGTGIISSNGAFSVMALVEAGKSCQLSVRQQGLNGCRSDPVYAGFYSGNGATTTRPRVVSTTAMPIRPVPTTAPVRPATGTTPLPTFTQDPTMFETSVIFGRYLQGTPSLTRSLARSTDRPLHAPPASRRLRQLFPRPKLKVFRVSSRLPPKQLRPRRRR